MRTIRRYTGSLRNPKDNRDIKYSRVATAINLPAKFITDISIFEVLHQYALGTCVAHADMFIRMYQEYKETGKITRFSRRYIYSQAWKLGGFTPDKQGVFPRDSAKVINTTGAYGDDSIDDNTLPHDVYVNLSITDEMKTKALPFKAGFAFPSVDLTELKTGIVKEGVISITLGYEATAGWNTGKLTKPTRVESFHRVVAYGYEDKDGDTIFYFRNSWGKDWGDKGCGEFKWSEYKKYFYDPIIYTDIPNNILEEAKNTQYRFEKNLKKGDRGYDVQKLQERLRDEGFYTYPELTQFFGDHTFAAVVAYQKKNKISPTSGIVGPLTRAKLNEVKKKSIVARAMAFFS